MSVMFCYPILLYTPSDGNGRPFVTQKQASADSAAVPVFMMLSFVYLSDDLDM